MQTLNHVKGDFQWVVVEDATECSPRVKNLVEKKFVAGKVILARQCLDLSPVDNRQTIQGERIHAAGGSDALGLPQDVGPDSAATGSGRKEGGAQMDHAEYTVTISLSPLNGNGINNAPKFFHERPTDPGIVYFADDDNTYDVELFAELRKTRRISMFPVGLIHPSGVSSPVLNDRGRVTGESELLVSNAATIKNTQIGSKDPFLDR